MADELRVLIVGVSEQTPLQHWNIHRLEIVGRNRVVERNGRRLARGHFVALYNDSVAIVVVTQRCRIRRARRDHARKRAHASQKILVELAPLRFVVANLVGIHHEIHHMIRIEAQVRFLRFAQAAREKPCDDQQHQGTGYLCHDQRVAHSMPASHQSHVRLHAEFVQDFRVTRELPARFPQ